jgi:hypothetical protein
MFIFFRPLCSGSGIRKKQDIVILRKKKPELSGSSDPILR